MTEPETTEVVACPRCGAQTPRKLPFCQHCQAELHEDGASVEPTSPFADTAGPVPIAEVASSRAPTHPHYTLASLLLMITLIGIFLGVSVRTPSAGVVLAFLGLPALVRTVLLNARRKATGRSMSFGEKVLAFAQSLGVVVAIAAVSGGTLAAIVYVAISGIRGRSANAAWVFSWLGVAICVSGLVGVGLLRRFWWPKE